MDYVTPLDILCEESSSTIGGKAANLVELKKIPGITVPEGFCVRSNAFTEFIKNLGLPKIVSDIREIEEFSRTVKNRIVSKEMPEKIAEEILSAAGSYKEPLAVRSSATLEDSKDYSFAGQQDSYLCVPKNYLIEKIKKCWASLYNSNALTYRIHLGIEEIGAMSVIIQEMVDAEVSGVMFTGHMASGNPDIVVINSTFGLCSPVVSGEVNPDVYYIRKSDGKIVRKKIAKKDLICRMENKRFRQMDISGTALSLQESLTETLLEELLETGLAIEDHYKCLQDIEFAIDNQLYIVQARPLKIKKLAA